MERLVQKLVLFEGALNFCVGWSKKFDIFMDWEQGDGELQYMTFLTRRGGLFSQFSARGRLSHAFLLASYVKSPLSGVVR